MLSPASQRALRQPTQVLHLIWFAFLASHFVYVAVAFFVSQTERSPLDQELAPYFQIGAVVLAGASILAATLYDRFALSEEKLRRRLRTMGAPEEVFSGGAVSGGVPEGFARLSTAEQKVVALLPHYQTSMIVRWAFLESVTIYGLVAFFIGALELRWFLAFPIVAFLMLATTRPDVSGVLDRMSRYSG